MFCRKPSQQVREQLFGHHTSVVMLLAATHAAGFRIQVVQVDAESVATFWNVLSRPRKGCNFASPLIMHAFHFLQGWLLRAQFTVGQFVRRKDFAFVPPLWCHSCWPSLRLGHVQRCPELHFGLRLWPELFGREAVVLCGAGVARRRGARGAVTDVSLQWLTSFNSVVLNTKGSKGFVQV